MSRPRPAQRHPLARGSAALVALVLAVLGGVAFLPTRTADAAAPTGCSYRNSATGSTTAVLARQLCWLDFSGLDFTTTNEQQRTITTDRYTITYTFRISGRPDHGTVSAVNVPWFTQALFGNTHFTGGSGNQIIKHDPGSSGWADVNMMRFTFGNIKAVDNRTGATVGGLQMYAMDAERTGLNEGWSFDNGDSTYAMPPVTLVGPPACSTTNRQATEGTTVYVASVSGLLKSSRDYVCEGTGADVGAPLVRVVNPTQFTVSTYSYATQGLAVAINLGQVGASVTADTTAFGATSPATYELAATGAETKFDLTVWNGNTSRTNPLIRIPVPGGTAVGPQDGSTVAYLRQFGSDGRATDTLSFESIGQQSPGGADKVMLRYTPTWTCYQNYGRPTQSTVALTPTATTSTQSATTASGTITSTVTYTTVNDAATGTSRVDVTNPDNLPIRCDVYWKTKFQTAQVNLTKLVQGTASGFPEVQNRQYYFNYTCTLAGFAAAYPSVPLTGRVTMSRNQTQALTGLPQGASCTFSETFPDNLAPALPGKRLTLTWDPSPTGTWDSIDHPEIYPPSSPTVVNPVLPTRTVTLGATTTVKATNQLDYRGGTVDISKTIVGEPVSELANTTKTYSFAWSCKDTDRSGTVDLTVTYAADGTASGTAPRLIDVPVERDCVLRPLTGLTAEQSSRISFLGRTVAVGGATPTPGPATAAADGYHFRISDYRDTDGATITSTNASNVTLAITTTYAYKTADLKLVKNLEGAAAAAAQRELTSPTVQTFPVSYACTYGNGRSLSGTARITTDAANPVAIPDVPLGATCRVWEDVAGAPQGTNVQLVTTATTVTGTDAQDASTTLSNDAAQTTPIQVVHQSSVANANTVVVANTYVQRLGTVSLRKAVDNGGLSGLPNTFTLGFDCGDRSVVQNGSTVSVHLTGTVQVSGGSSAPLVVNQGDAAQAALVNDGPGGVMQVPYGNACTFTESAITGLPTGITVTNDAAAQGFTVGAPTAERTVTNTFRAAGRGLTIQQSVAAHAELAPASTTYQVTCDNGFSTSVSLSASTPSQTIPNTSVPAGVTCTVTEQPVDPGTRTTNGTTYPITRSTTAAMPSDGTHPAVNATYASGTSSIAGVAVTGLVVGESSVLTISHSYDFVYRSVDASKVVAFDPATQQWISAQRQQVKKDRLFTITLACTEPTGGTQDLTAQVSATTTSLAGATKVLGQLAVGSTCVATEGESTTAAGVVLTRQAAYNGSPDTDATTPAQSVRFTVADQANRLTFTNSYTRQLATLQLNKLAIFPPNVDSAIRSLYGTDLNTYLHDHRFTLDCRDPMAQETPLGTPLTGSIKGEGSVTFTGVPVGTDCHIAGDNFTQLDLSTTRADGVTLESHFTTAKVDWVVDKNDGTTFTDTDLPGGVTESDYFVILADGADGTPGNVVDLKNTYQFVMTDIHREKQVVATAAGWELIQASNPSYSFTYRCSGVGFDDWTVTTDVPDTLTVQGDFTGPATSNGGAPETFTRTWVSAPYQVPAGAWCVGTELPATNTPPQLTHTIQSVDATGAVVDQSTLAHRAPGGSEPGNAAYVFVDRYTRRMVPVRLVMMHDGYWQGADAAGYTMTVTCNDPAGTTVSRTSTLADTLTTEVVSAASPPASGGAVRYLPVDATCTLTLGGSPALAARPELEYLQGSRTPFVAYGLWAADGTAYAPDPARASNPTAPPARTPLDDAHVTPVMKAYSFTFDIGASVVSPGGDAPALTLGAEAVHPQDRVTLTLAKTTEGSVGEGATFQFRSTCTPDLLTLRAGESVSVPDVPVNSDCSFTEIDDGVASSEAQLWVAPDGAGKNLSKVTVTNKAAVPATETDPAQDPVHAVSFHVDPVESATDPATDGAGWQLTVVNRFPSVHVEKTIAGPVVLSPLDTAALSAEATSMQVTYVVRNDGALPLTAFGLTDSSLAGRTLHRADATLVVGADGVIDPAFCGLGPETSLASGAEVTCTFDVDLPPAPGLLSIRGDVVVTADAQGTPVTDEDGYGAFRPLLNALPTTGMQTLVWVLGAGALLLLVGLWRSRRSADDEADTDADDVDVDRD